MKRTGFKSPRKPMRKRSPKRAAYMASQARQDGLAHMARVKALPCCACGAPPPSSAHHCTGDKMPRDDMRTIPLCYSCHQGPSGYHAAKRSWVEKHGPDYGFLPEINHAIYGKND